MNSFYNQLLYNQEWFVLKVEMRLSAFLLKFKSASQFYRLISNSQYRFLKESNHTFFKCVDMGYYRMTINNGSVRILFILKFNETNRKHYKIRELAIRIKRLLFCRVSILEPRDLDETDKELLSHEDGVNLFQKIKNSYSNKSKITLK
jgi:hypothetical protein